MFEPEMMDLFWHFLTGRANTCLERVLYIMSNVGGWWEDPRCKYKKVIMPKC